MIGNSRIEAEINLDVISDNFDKMHGSLKDGTLMAAVIKADGYGHGAVMIGRMLEEKDYIWGYCTATAEEALELRHAGLKKPILTLGYIFPEHYEAMIENDIRSCLFTEKMAADFSKAAVRTGRKGYCHLAVDTGMGRIGFRQSEEAFASIERIAAMPGLELEGMFTHFARADEEDTSEAARQLEEFLGFNRQLEKRNVRIPLLHASNSAGILKLKDANLSMVRAGITMYGLDPSAEVTCRILDLKPAMTLRSHLTYIKTVPAGTAISYGGTYVTEKPARVATVPAGYADGYPRQLSNKGCVIIRGQKAPILGRVCMDQFMVDVTHIPEASEGDEVILLGKMGKASINAEEIGSISGRFNYEFVCDINKRVPRIYIRDNRPIQQVDYFS